MRRVAKNLLLREASKRLRMIHVVSRERLWCDGWIGGRLCEGCCGRALSETGGYWECPWRAWSGVSVFLDGSRSEMNADRVDAMLLRSFSTAVYTHRVVVVERLRW